MAKHSSSLESSPREDDAVQVSRRSLLAGSATASLVTLGCAGGARRWQATRVDVINGQVALNIDQHPPLATPGGMVAIHPAGVRKPIIVIRAENNAFQVMSSKCPHLGCTVRWDDEQQNIVCPCHGSRFDDKGGLLKGPAKQALSQYKWSFGDLVLRIQIDA